jgi:hypothetical protein
MERKPIIEVYAPRPRTEPRDRGPDMTWAPRRENDTQQAKPPVPSGGSGVHIPKAATKD